MNSCRDLRKISNHEKQQHIKLISYAFICYSNVSTTKCKKCDFATHLKVSLTHHYIKNHKEDFIINHNNHQFRSVVRKCEYCDFQTYSTLLSLKHDVRCDKRVNWGTDETKDTNWLECVQCSYKTQNKTDFRKHMKNRHSNNFTSFQYGKCPLKTKWRDHVNIRHESFKNIEWWQCEQCEYKTMRKLCLQQHIINIHTESANIKWHYCDTCEYKAKWKSSLKLHVSYIHRDSANIVWHHCDKCEYKSKVKSNLRKHTINVHTDAANVVWYHCDKCEHKVKDKGNLRKHMANIHTDSTNVVWYHCDKCKFKTKCKSNVKRHATAVHKDSEKVA